MVSEGSPGHGPIHILSAAEVGFRWDPLRMGWSRPELAGLVQHFKAAILEAWRSEVAADLCGRDKALLRSVMVGGVWNGRCLELIVMVGMVIRWRPTDPNAPPHVSRSGC